MRRDRTSTPAITVLAAVATAGPLLYIALTIVLGLLWAGYDPIRDTQSELGAVDSPYRDLMNLGGFLGLGVSILALAVLYAVTLRTGWPLVAVCAALVLAGAGMVAVSFFPCDAGCVDVTTTGRMHGLLSAPGAIGLPTAAMLSSWAFHADGRLGRRWQTVSMALGALTLASGPVIAAEWVPALNGLLQRAGMWPVLIWAGVVAHRLGRLSADAGRSRPSADT